MYFSDTVICVSLISLPNFLLGSNLFVVKQHLSTTSSELVVFISLSIFSVSFMAPSWTNAIFEKLFFQTRVYIFSSSDIHCLKYLVLYEIWNQPFTDKGQMFFLWKPWNIFDWSLSYISSTCVKGVKKCKNVTGLGKDMQQPPIRASYKQMDLSQCEIDSTSNIYVEYGCVDTTRNVATFPILNGIFIHPWFLVKANAQGLLCIKGAGTPEAAVFSETQFGADQNGTLETLSLPIYFHS